MRDPRLEKLARVLVHHSLELKAEELLIIAGNALTAPLMREVYAEALRVGAHPETQVRIADLDEIFLSLATDAQMAYISPVAMTAAQQARALLSILGEYNTRGLSHIDPGRQAALRRARKPLSDVFYGRMDNRDLKWCGVQFPTQADAQEAGMSLTQFEDFVYRACLLEAEGPVAEWKQVRERQEGLVRYLNGVKHLRVLAEDTDRLSRPQHAVRREDRWHHPRGRGPGFHLDRQPEPVCDTLGYAVRYAPGRRDLRRRRTHLPRWPLPPRCVTGGQRVGVGSVTGAVDKERF
ncbi:MAG TPA: aminopeptidase [Firmicutes bacterium]|nr:aminopeptidase [Bacillota bacterium]